MDVEMAAADGEELKGVLRNKLSEEDLRLFRDADYDNLASNGFCTAKSFEAATRDDLKDALPGRAAIVALLVKTFLPGGNRRTPPRPVLVDLLKTRQLPRGSSHEQVVKWIEETPISFETTRFLKAHIFDVRDDLVVANERSLPKTHVLMRRMDHMTVLLDKANRGAKVVVLSGRRRHGKTCTVATEMLHLRHEKSGVKDRAIFYHSGIAACWDEFPNVEQDLGMAYKLIVEDGTVALDDLSVLLWGSREIDVRDKGALLSGLQSKGVFKAKLPDPSMLGMYYISQSVGATKPHQELWDPEAFIRMFLVCGYNLADYAGGCTFKDTLYDGVDEVSALSGSKLVAVRRIIADHSSTVT